MKGKNVSRPLPDPLPGPGQNRPTFAEVYDRGVGYVWRTLGLLGVAARDCPDAAQEVFIVVHRRLPEYEERGRLNGWLAAITGNVALQVRDQNRAESRRDLDADPEDFAALSDALPADQEDGIATHALVLHLLEAVEPKRRLVLVMHHVDGMTTAEIAEDLGLPKGTVDTRLRTAQQEFKDARHRYAVRASRETRTATVLPILGPLTLLEALRQTPPMPPGMREQIWARLAHLEHGGGGGGGGGGSPSGPGRGARALRALLSPTAAPVALAAGFVLGALWAPFAASPDPAPTTPRTLAEAHRAALPGSASASTEETPSIGAAPAASAAPATGAEPTSNPPQTSADANAPHLFAQRAALQHAARALHAGNFAEALALAEEHARRWPGSRFLAAEWESVRIPALLGVGRAAEARDGIDRLARLRPDDPQLATFRAALTAAGERPRVSATAAPSTAGAIPSADVPSPGQR